MGIGNLELNCKNGTKLSRSELLTQRMNKPINQCIDTMRGENDREIERREEGEKKRCEGEKDRGRKRRIES